jgi:hypothetical protein
MINRRAVMGAVVGATAAAPEALSHAIDRGASQPLQSLYWPAAAKLADVDAKEVDNTADWHNQRDKLERLLRGEKTPWELRNEELARIRGRQVELEIHLNGMKSLSPVARQRIHEETTQRRNQAAQRQEWLWDLEDIAQNLAGKLLP